MTVGAPEPRPWVIFVLREQRTPSEAFDFIYDRVMRRLVELWASVIGRMLGRPPDDPEVILRTLTVVGQLAFFRRGQGVVLRALGWPDFRGDRLAKVKDALWKQLEGAF